MNAYRAKNVLWLGIVLIGVLIALSGCSSTAVADRGPQYCYTTQNIQTTNGERVQSQTQVECSDKPGYWHKQAGVAKQCRSYQTVVNIKGRDKNVQGYLCQHPDGSWRPEFN
jgi:hypothetical protein